MPHADLQRAKELLRGGQLDAALALCRQLQADQLQDRAPREPAVWQMLGYIELQRGRLPEAEAHLRQAAELDPQQAQTWSQLALVLRRSDKVSEAEACARQALALDSQNRSAWLQLGECYVEQRRWPEAAQALLLSQGGHPQDAAAWLALGQAEQTKGRLDVALEAFAQSVRLAPDNEQAVSYYGLLLSQRGRLREAHELLGAYVARQPNSGAAWFVFGQACEHLAKMQQAEAAQRRAIALAPDAKAARDAQLALARLIHGQTRVVEADQITRQLLAANPNDADAWHLRARIQQALSEPDAAIESLRRSHELAPSLYSHLTLLVGSQYASDVEPGPLLAAHRAWDAVYAQPLTPQSPPRAQPLAPGQKLRLGFVSADFGQHPIGFLTLRAVECLDKQQFNITCYSDRAWEDDFTSRFSAVADVWRSVKGQTNEELAAQVRADGIDILFDLGGFGGQRLLAFAARPAPVQIAWLGYPGTTGMAAMDYLLADRFHVSPDDESHYAETILRLPHCYTCYEAPAAAPPVGPLPALQSGTVTFGCLNNPCKFSPQIIATWAAILSRLPRARLLFKYSWLGEREVQDALRAKFTACGASPEQILIEDAAVHREFLATYQRIDLALDTQPYSGGLTTCEALWMGVPVITTPGSTFAGRHSLSYLSNTGLPQFVAPSLEEYVELAVQWASRLQELAEIRAGLREQLLRSPLCDAPQFARDLGDVLLGAWRRASAERTE